jgi:hypothetical protein
MKTRGIQQSRCVVLLMAAALAAFGQTASKITSPKEALGFAIGDDYHLASYTQLEGYWKRLAAESDRMRLADIGPTAEGRRQYMAIISSPANLRNLDRYKRIARRLALAEDLDEEQARALAREGRAVVWIDGGLHAPETVGSQQLIEMVYQMVSRNDEETLRFLDDVILLCVAANPDGLELVADWYMREPEPRRRSLADLPRLYQKYIGHDNNRDFYMSNMPETTNMNRQLFLEWFPQIMYNHHQSGPPGTVIFMPPFRDPFNYHFDPLVPLGIELVGTAMHSRLVAEGKGGSVMRTGANYSTWWNGGLRTITYFHNMIGLLTEIIGSPTPIEIPLVADKQLPTGDWPLPVAPQTWHFRQSIDYSISNNRAILDVASRYRETFLFNIYRMGRNSIEKGSRDHWTVTPKRIAELQAAAERQSAPGRAPGTEGTQERLSASRPLPSSLYATVLQDAAKRDPRGFILPSTQPDFPTATAFINALLKTGITVHRAAAAFRAAGKTYPAGSYVVKTAQAFRPHVMDMFEPQDHPNDFRYPGGPPNPPYDVAGWTLARQMGVEFDRVLDAFEGPFVKVEGLQAPPPAAVEGPANPAGYLVSHRVNNSFILVNRLLKAGAPVYWLKDRGEPGRIWIPSGAGVRPALERAAKELGVAAEGRSAAPSGDAWRLKPVRIGLADVYGGSMSSGWTRWLLEQYEFPFEVVYPQLVDAGGLNARFEVLVFTDGVARLGGAPPAGAAAQREPDPARIPEPYRAWLGRYSQDKSLPRLREFVEAGGTLVAIGSSTSMAALLGLPVRNHLVEKGPDGRDRQLPREKYYIPGSLLRTEVDNQHPLAYGMPRTVEVVFNNSPVFRLDPDAAQRRTAAVLWFAGPEPLTSGWAWGQQYLDGGAAVVEAAVGRGRVVLLGPEVAFRAQPHATFKLLFNSLHYGGAGEVRLP